MLLDAGSHFCCMLDHFTCIHTVTRRIHLWSNFGCGLHGYMLSEKKTDSSLVEDVGDHLVLEANLGIYFVSHRLVKCCFCYEENQRPVLVGLRLLTHRFRSKLGQNIWILRRLLYSQSLEDFRLGLC
jgi:hypothetical protein